MIQLQKGCETMTLTLELVLLILIALGILLLLIRSYIKTDTTQNQQELLNRNFNNLTDRLDTKINDLNQRNVEFERTITSSLIQFHDRTSATMGTQFDKLQESVEKRLMLMDRRMSESLEEGFKKTNQTFTNIVERLSKIDEAQKKIDALSFEIVSLQNVLTDKKTRGAFGEVQLAHILASIFGEKNDKIYQLQYTFSTGSRSDAVLFAPEPLGTLAIDSKFPLENYRRMVDVNISPEARTLATKTFVSDVKAHIDAIANKYIIPNETSNQAIMFVPAEAIFATINAYHEDIIDYSQKRRVWLASPTTLMSTLTTIQTILINLEREKYAAEIHDHLRKLSVEFDRYRNRWNNLSRHMDTLHSDFKQLDITTEKITKRFDDISNVDVQNTEAISNE